MAQQRSNRRGSLPYPRENGAAGPHRGGSPSPEVVAECGKTDRYGREVCRVLVGGVDAGLEQVRGGLAWFFRRYAKELPPDRRQPYADTEAEARADRRGLWADGEPVAPWDWRGAVRR